MKYQITLGRAVEMITLYRSEKENILANSQKNRELLPIAETFERSAIDRLLKAPGCASLRIYYGMSADLKVHAILVAVDANGNDLVPSQNKNAARSEVDDEPVIVEEAFRCPPICPPKSQLNP